MSVSNVLNWVNTGVGIANGGISAWGQIENIKRANKVQKTPDVKTQVQNVTKTYDEETKQEIIKTQKSARERDLMMKAFLMSKMTNDRRNDFKDDNTFLYVAGAVCLFGVLVVAINNKNKTKK